MLRPVLAALALLTFTACDLPTGGAGEVEIRVAGQVHAPGDVLRVTLLNRTRQEYGYGACSLSLQRRTEQGWSYVGPERRVCTAQLYIVRPGESEERPFPLPSDLPEGQYRFAENVLPDTSLPDTVLHSESFQVRVGG